MRLVKPLGGMLLALAAAAAVHAQQAPQTAWTATVKDAEAEVRSGPSTDAKMYPTNKLRKGETVEVVKELPDGWLAIYPPRGSFSWINTRFLERFPNQSPYWLVVAHDDAPAPVRVGSEVFDGKPTVERTRLKRGATVIGVGKELQDDGKADGESGTWLPIIPPPSELRYIKADAVVRPGAPSAAGPVQTAPAAETAAPPPAPFGGAAPAPAAAAAGPLGSPEALWQEAQRTEQAGKLAEAERLYAQLGRDVCNSNHDLAMRCYNRLEYLRNTSRPTFQEVGYSGLGQDNRLYPVPMNANGQPLVCYAPCAPAAGQPPPPAAPAQDLAATTAPQASGAGRLRLAGRGVDYRRAYVLENSQGQLLMYVTAAQGVDLEPYVNRNVDLYGPIVYRGDLRANYLTALRVTPMP